MHPLHDYIANQIADLLKDRGVVVLYDPLSELVQFFGELEASSSNGVVRTDTHPNLVQTVIAGATAWVAEYDGSFLELRASVEPLTNRDELEPVVIYLPGCTRDDKSSFLLELELAGTRFERTLESVARSVLSQRYTVGVVDGLLVPGKMTYEDLARASAPGPAGEPPSPLKVVFRDVPGNEALLATWIASSSQDADLTAKDAVPELSKLIQSRLGLELPRDAPLTKLRAIVARYVLANEFRGDLDGEPPATVAAIAMPLADKQSIAVRELALRLRTSFADAYMVIADRVEEELGLRAATIAAERLGSIDTFRFEERALLKHCGELIANKKFDAALKIVAQREHSFWLERDVARKTQWDACRQMAALGLLAVEVHAAVRNTGGDARAWIEAYTGDDGWHRLDEAHRHLEVRIRHLDDDPDERALAIVRREYEDACQAMTVGFTKAIERAHWAVPEVLHQTHVFSDVVTIQPKPVAYFFVDAMRFEMGVELRRNLPTLSETWLRPAVAALPSITQIGMAALLPGASGSFSIAESKGTFGARIDDAFLADLPSRKKHAAARIAKAVDLTLDEVLTQSKGKLEKKLEGVQVVIVRSQEIDLVGESGLYQARVVMDLVIGNLVNAIKKLARLGIEHAVVSADHGHLFASERDESMRIDAPGGDTIDLHRRCWVGRGGATPPGCVRVAASALGYASDLDLVFPVGCGVFKAGGDLAFHHGGPSLQELIVPVLTVRTKLRASERPSGSGLSALGAPEAITNRIFTVKLHLGGPNLAMFNEAKLVRPVLTSGDKQVGAVCTVVDAVFDAATGCVTLPPNVALTVAFLLSDDSVKSLRIVVQDPTTDAELYRSPTEIPVRL